MDILTYRLNTLANAIDTRFDAVEASVTSSGGSTSGFPAPVADRTELAVLPASHAAAYLTESGRAGIFVWDSSDLSAKVTADTQQGIYVAPTSALTGASGAWVRQFDGPILPGWFGALADDDNGVSGTNNSAAFLAISAVIQARAKVGVINPTIYRGGDEVLIVGRFYIGTATIEPLATIKMRGIGGLGWGAPSRIRTAAGTTALRAQAHNTSGTGTLDGANHYAGDAWVVEDIYFLGAFTTTEAEAHGCHAKRVIHINRCTFDKFEGDGLYINASFGAGAPTEGNANCSRVTDCVFTNCRNGRFVEGDDANACAFIGNSYINNRRWGIEEDSFLGNHEFGAHFDANGFLAWNTGTATQPCSYVSHGGNIYFAIHGQETGASTNAPSGTTADNTWWGYWSAGAPADARPAWVSGITVRSGGPILIHGDNNASTIYGSHAESNGICQIGQLGYVAAGSTLVCVSITGAGILSRNRGNILTPSSTGLRAAGNLKVAGDFTALSPTNGIGPNTGATVQDGITNFGSRNTGHTINFRVYDSAGAVTTTIGSFAFGSGFGASYDMTSGAAFQRWKIGGTERLKVDSTGITVTGLVDSSGVYKNAGVQVVATRKTGWAVDTGTAKRTANATYSGTAEVAYTQATVQTLMDAVRDLSQTVKALKDDLHGTAGHGLIGT